MMYASNSAAAAATAATKPTDRGSYNNQIYDSKTRVASEQEPRSWGKGKGVEEERGGGGGGFVRNGQREGKG